VSNQAAAGRTPDDMTTAPRGLAMAYVWVVIAAGAIALLQAGLTVAARPVDPRWLLLTALTIAGAIATLRMRLAPVSFSISDTFTFTTVLLISPSHATLTAALEALTISLLIARERRQIHRIPFNVAAVALAMRLAGPLMVWLAPRVLGGSHLATLFLAVFAGAGAYFLINTSLVAGAIALEARKPIVAVWREHFMHLWLNFCGGAYTALLLVVFAPSLDVSLCLLLLPLPLVIYLGFRMWLGRVEDRLAFLDTSNRHYRATIDALAHAVDAKDQVTHGHIQRVQTYCLALARALGHTDEGDLRALEAASLLHDVGKIAIPEHILNKPGRLSAAEFERMKQHAAIGADILSSIEFPYPVVPIVRHHHEGWNGSGYPDGLAGTAIPIGARILAVVDCYDALMSDRPYRPRMQVEQALAILRERAGTMYDPSIVEGFLRLLPELPQPAVPTPQLPALVAASAAAAPGTETATATPAGSAWEMLLPALCTAFRACGVVFVHDEHTDMLRPAAASGPIRHAVEGLQIPLGQRLSGWVGATRAAQRNADPRLDLDDAALAVDPPLVSALCVPIEDASRLLGVVTLYSAAGKAFTEADLGSLRTFIGMSVRLDAAIALQGSPDRRSAA